MGDEAAPVQRTQLSVEAAHVSAASQLFGRDLRKQISVVTEMYN